MLPRPSLSLAAADRFTDYNSIISHIVNILYSTVYTRYDSVYTLYSVESDEFLSATLLSEGRTAAAAQSAARQPEAHRAFVQLR